MSGAPGDPPRATRLVLEAQLAARGVSGRDLDDASLRQLTETSGPELRLIAALLDTLDIAPGLLPSSAPAEAGVAPSLAPARDSLAENLIRMEASLPPVTALAPGDLDRLLPRVESVVEHLVSGAPDEAP
jgi:hypothetical protein